VNAFGFGGINAHAVLEDAPSVLPWESLTPQSSELFLVEAESTAQVIARLNEWSRRSETLRDSDLGEICFTELQRSSGQHPYRLAIVAKDLAELRTKLDRARNRLAEETHAFWQDPSGIFYGASRYPGKLGFLFPGIGFPGLAGGYASRLADLYLHFPEVRRNLDLVDSLTREDNAAQPLSYQLFPPPMLDRAALVQIERDLGWSDRSPIGMSMANMAAWELLKSFGLRADAVAGFSLGELSSLFASEVIDPEHFNLETVRRVRRIMKGFSKASGDVDVLWAMVATSAERAESMMHGLPGNVSVTMDVSPQQIFIGGDASTVRAALQRFQEAKIWGQALPVLPMLLPYLRVHTEQASPFEEQLRMILEAMPLGAGKCPIYSGTTATRYPETPDGIRDMILASVTQPVRIRDTIRAMYADGIRIFVQLGAGGKMLPNVQNTLEGSDHVALSTDLQHRGGLEQIHHLLGRLATLGVPFDLSSLYRYRRCRDLDAPKKTAKSGLRKLSLKPPRVRLPGETVEWIRSQHVAAPEPPPQHPEPTPPPAPVRRNGSFADQTASMMQRFLAEQQSWEDAENQLLHQFLTTQHAAAQALSYYGSSAAQATAVEEAPAEVTWEAEARLRRPFVGVVEHFVPGQELESRLVLDLSRHLFLPEHALINLPDGLKPAEERLATLPLTFEMEILAEVAEALVPELHVVACHSLEAKRWIALESKSTLEIAVRARRIDASEVEVELQPEGHAQPAFRGRATLSSEWPATPEPLAQAYDRECPHTPEQFYSTGPLFHGPMFQLIRSFSGMSHGDIGGELVANGPEAHLGQTTELPMVFEPLLLDALQQIVGYRAWLDGWFTMPIGMKRIWRFAPPPAPGSRVRASVQYRKVDGRRIEASYEAYNEAGQLWVRIDGLQAWRVLCPKTLLEANHRPREGYLGLPWSVGRAGVTCYRVTRDQLGDLNPDWIARLYLRANEWAAYHQRPAVDWLLGRIAAKDAARAWLREHKGLLLHPLEVEIVNEADGAPRLLVPAWPSVAISIAHIEDEAIAVVSEVAGLGVDVAAVKDRGREFSDFAFRKDELACLPEPERQAWIHRGWCAKEAAVKAYRLGFGQLPQFRIDSVEEGTGTMEMHWESGGIRVAADTWLDGKRTIAVVVPET
jgi:malonyl CoA-acyl carrier protein transacylase/phosphopantetheinyl transferase